MAIQEMAELIKELTDVPRKRTSPTKIAHEIADVEIMLEQLKIIFNNESLVNKIKKEQLNKILSIVESVPKKIKVDYNQIFLDVKGNKKLFFTNVKNINSKLKEGSISRRWYDAKKENEHNIFTLIKKKKSAQKKQPSPKKQQFVPKVRTVDEITIIAQTQNISKPDMFKLMTYKDMTETNHIITEYFLKKHGFNQSEINWLKINGKL